MDNNKANIKYDGKPIEHEFDGIKELNNPPPPWIMYLFYITVVFSVGYWIYYHVAGIGDLQEQEYLSEMKEEDANVAISKAATSSLEIVLLTDEESLNNGENLFKEKTCIVCHGSQGGGNAIGPNLTDNYWINGNTIENVFEMVKNGKPTKGMTPFKDQMTEKQMLEVSSYILGRLVGSTPDNPKDPQGELIN